MIKVRGGVFVGLGILYAATYSLLCSPPVLAQGVAPAGKAAVFIYRSDRTPVQAPVPLTVNAERAGNLANGTFIVAIVPPGKVFLRAGDRILSSLSLQASANRNYFVRLEATSALLPVRTQMRQVSESAARGPLRESRFVGRGAAAEAAAKSFLGAAPAAAAASAAPRTPRSAPPPPAPHVAQAAPPPPAPRAAPPSPRPAPAPVAASSAAEPGWDIAVIVKGGAFKLSNEAQVVGGQPGTFDTTSRPAAGAEVEWRSRNGLAVGSEVFYYKNKVTAIVAGTTRTAEQTVLSFFLNGKYYLQVTDWFYPFAGVGIGGAGSSYSGDLTGKASGLAYQGMAGAEFRFGNVGLYLEYKALASTTDDGANEKVKIGGKGAFAGLSVIF
jgi:opacity protein-like surface antigen